MRRFIYKLSVFLAVPLLVILVMDLYLRNMNSYYLEKYDGAEKAADSIEVLIVGNSHACYAVDPQAFDLYTYNIANVSQSIYFDKRITLSLINQLPQLKYVFISVDYHSLYFSSQKFRDFWSYYGNGIKYKDKSYFLANLSPTIFGYTPKVAISMIKKSIIQKYLYGDNGIDFSIEEGVNLNNSIEKGFVSFDGTNESMFNEKEYRNREEEFTSTVLSSKEKDEIINDLEGFIAFLIEKNITPILFTSPTYIEYNSFLSKAIIDENKADINKICRKYNIRYWDFSNSKRYNKQDFFNCDHLNKTGAHKFSKSLNDSISSIYKY